MNDTPVNYSQNGEQAVILEYFRHNQGIQNPPTFLDLGANDGITLSNTWALACNKWNGVLVDASPKAFERLKTNYRGVKGISVYHLALATYDGKITLQESGELISDKDVALVSSVNQSEVDRFKGAVRYEPVIVPCFTWKTFLEASPIKEFTMISMDIEGSELDVLPHMDLSETMLVCIEWNGKQELRHEYNRHLQGFKIIYTSAENMIYAR